MGGGIVSGPRPGGFYPTNVIAPPADNISENINAWSPIELQNFIKWFIEVNHPEAVKQYQAIRAIERKAEEAAKVEADLRMAELLKQYHAAQIQGMQNAYPFTPTTTTQKSFWDRAKEMAGYK